MTTIFDRFESDRDPGIDSIVNDLTDLLGARRAYTAKLPGILNWGLSLPRSLSPSSPQDREYLARHIEEVIREFEPRLAAVHVNVVDAAGEFRYEILARRADVPDQAIALRVLTPRRGGGLGAEVVVLGAEGNGNP